MSTYPNGKIPDRLLIRRGDFLLTAGTWAKFDDLVGRVKRRTGVTLRISTGSTVATRGAGAFRTYAMQVAVKKYWTDRGQSRMAASPGTSSHGGEYKGDDALAIDITNYSQIPLSVFFDEGRNAGFQMGYFDGNGKPYEPWHIIDRDPYRMTPATAGIEGEDMPLTTEDLDKIATRVWAHMIQPQDENGNYVTGAFPARGFLSSVAAQAQAAKTAAQAAPAGVWNHLVQAQDAQGNLLKHPDGTPVLWPARGYLASIGGQVGAIQTADVDEKALAAQLAPLLTAQVGALSDEDVARLAAAVADEQARRLAAG